MAHGLHHGGLHRDPGLGRLGGTGRGTARTMAVHSGVVAKNRETMVENVEKCWKNGGKMVENGGTCWKMLENGGKCWKMTYCICVFKCSCLKICLG